MSPNFEYLKGAEKKNHDNARLIAECVQGLDKSKDGKIDKSETVYRLFIIFLTKLAKIRRLLYFALKNILKI